jgi:nitroreductase
MKHEELVNLIKSRRSIRKWENKPVPEETLCQAIELSSYAPNAGNQQNWYFQVILKKETISALAEAVKDATDELVSWPEAKILGEKAQGLPAASTFFKSAPAGIAISANRYDSAIDQVLAAREKVENSAGRVRKWRDIADSRMQSIGAAISYLVLILHQQGLGTVWMTGPMIAKGKLEEILKIPSTRDLVAYIPVGYPAENPALKERKKLKEICETIK